MPRPPHVELPHQHQEFLNWALENGVTVNHIRPAVLPGAGLGIIATSSLPPPPPPSIANGSFNLNGSDSSAPTPKRRRLSPGTTLAATPSSLLVNRDSVHRFCPRLPSSAALTASNISTHAILALALAIEKDNPNNFWRPWLDILPTAPEFQELLPLFWDVSEQDLLPPSAKSLLDKQTIKYALDWREIQNLLSNTPELTSTDLPEDTFKWAWAAVNTRTLYYKPETPERESSTRDDFMTLCPFIDYFNHSSTGCHVAFSHQAGYSVTLPVDTPRINENDEIFVSYGCHSNDFLLVEYGFILPEDENRWDDLNLDPLLTPTLHPSAQTQLEEEGFWGNYTADRNGVCYRTQAVARMALIPMGTGFEEGLLLRWRRFLRGEDAGEREQHVVDEWVRRVLAGLRGRWGEVERKVAEVGGQKGRVVEQRWMQVLRIVEGVEKGLVV
ncbi:SET domain-containing protein [Ascodesmis nigricans]|uniref:SET domain-containing protein n=1 Tax=Ascodesmis nigricans TaxID=341454 RepID=A0A4S2MM36_9PEZI|nr:SET domain-containing protein [Ascodesmis nigricans]